MSGWERMESGARGTGPQDYDRDSNWRTSCCTLSSVAHCYTIHRALSVYHSMASPVTITALAHQAARVPCSLLDDCAVEVVDGRFHDHRMG